MFFILNTYSSNCFGVSQEKTESRVKKAMALDVAFAFALLTITIIATKGGIPGLSGAGYLTISALNALQLCAGISIAIGYCKSVRDKEQMEESIARSNVR